MAITVANVSSPNQQITESSFMGLKARMVDLTLDSLYLTTGEVLTAAMLGWDSIVGVIVLSPPSVSDGTTSTSVVCKPNTALTQVAIQPQYSGGDGVVLEEAGSTDDLSSYTMRVIALGT